MRVERISTFQLLALIIFHEIGSTTLFARGIEAKQDAWISIIIGMMIGFMILWVYTQIQLSYPDKNLPEILMTVLGKWIACPLILLYAGSFFLHQFLICVSLPNFLRLRYCPKHRLAF